MPNILFDLDGTLTDAKPSITRSIQYALLKLGYTPPDADELGWYIGPPIQETFSLLLKTSDETLLAQAISLYRDRFSTIGLFENLLYPQIPATLKILRADGYKTFVATSKPYIYTIRIIEHFGLTSLFDGIYGSELDGTRSAKGDLIGHILLTEKLSPSTVFMVGDRKYDMIGAKRHQVAAIGVTYGYGTEKELITHGADWIAHSPEDIPKLLVRG
ncbi:HAD hydrolase-like protein [Nostoc sp. 106C]|uniref:HAD hydrolase-like protein n=1 Tax=Nostoc sp. 106C TaxID=1932667 RepID=UPI000A3CE2F4|nr:HAD hydrolase-like protein [Nostoc sp. 106C]OUL20782.1 HAD family hydrolase [Nostoc sp. 106C]